MPVMRLCMALCLFMALFIAASIQESQAGLSYSLQPTFTVSQELTDNLFLTPDSEKTEWITVISPGIEFQAEGPISLTTLSYEPGITIYNTYDEFNGVRHNVSFDYQKEASQNTSISLANDFLLTDEPIDRGGNLDRYGYEPDSDFVDFTQQRGREDRIVNTAQGRVEHQFGPHNVWYLQHRYRYYEDDNLGAEDGEEHSPETGLTYRIAERTDLLMALGYTRTDYSNDDENDFDSESDSFDEWDGRMQVSRIMTRFLSVFAGYRHTYVNYDGDEVDYQVYSPSVGAEYRFAEWGTASVGVGYFIQDFEESEDNFTDTDNNEGFVLNSEIDMHWEGRRWTFGARVTSGYEQASVGSDSRGLTLFYGGNLAGTYAMTRHLEARASAEYRYYDYQDNEAVTASESDFQEWEQLWAVTAGLEYQLMPRLTLDLEGKHEVVTSDIYFDEYTENSAILSITYRPQGYRF